MSTANSFYEEKDIAFHLHPFTDLKAHESTGPLVIDNGEGVYLIDSSGRRYLDGMASLWCCALGYNEPRLIEAAHEQIRRLPYSHTFRGRSHEKLIDLSEKLVSMAPGTMSKVLFANSGSEANDTAMKLAWYYNNARGKPEKTKIIAREGGYHGTTIATASLSGQGHMHRKFNLPIPGILYADCPHYYRYGEGEESEEEFASRLAQNLDDLIVAEEPETVAAFIAEPVMGTGGVIVPPRTYFQKVQAVLRKYDVLFIADEVICGFGRTGNMFGSTTFKIEPDMITMAKSLSSAYFPISALLVSGSIYGAMVENSDEIGVFGHGFTYSGHPVGAAVALEAIRIYEERDIVGHVGKVGSVLQEGLRALASHPLVGDARGIGLMGAIEFVANKETKEGFDPDLKVGERLVIKAEENGLFVRAIDDTIVMAPPLVISEDQILKLLDILEMALNELQKTFTD